MSAAEVIADGWTAHLCREETRDGREVQMPQWVMDYAGGNVDASDGAAIRQDPDGWRLCNCYLWDDTVDPEALSLDEARRAADAYNAERGIAPLVLPSSWAVIGAGLVAPVRIGGAS